MKILRDTFELAKATAKESEVPLWLVGCKGVITDIVVINTTSEPEQAILNQVLHYYSSSNGLLDLVPIGMHRYGKVITKYDRYPEPGCNLIEDCGRWHFVDECGDEVAVEIVCG